MLLHPSFVIYRVSPPLLLPPSTSSTPTLPIGLRSISVAVPAFPRKRGSVSCSAWKTIRSSSSRTVDFERRSTVKLTVKWNTVYKRISLMENPEKGSGTVLSQWENEGKSLNKWELRRVVKELRKYKRFESALQVYEWMNKREERFQISSSDAAIQIDLIGKVRGIASAEDYFLKIPEKSKDQRIYGALLNAYSKTKMRKKAEALISVMRDKGYASSALPYNVLMTLYVNIKEYNKVESTVSEMMEKKIPLDIYSYNIWLSARGSQGPAERMEQVLEQMKLERTISPNWTTFSTMATMYIKQGQFDKAEDCLKKVETRIMTRDQIPYHYLISLYASTGNKNEIYRVWKLYKLNFLRIPNLGYLSVISSLIRLGDFEGAKRNYEEWLTVKSKYDPRIGNLMMGWFVKEGLLDQAEEFFDHMVEAGGKPNSVSWEILAEGHIRERRVSQAMSCLKEASLAEGAKKWRPKPVNMSLIFEQCEEEGDISGKEALIGLLKEKGWLENKAYASLVGLSLEEGASKDVRDNREDEDVRADMLLD